MANKKILLLVITDAKHGATYYFSSEKYVTLPSDSIPNQIFEPRIANDPTFSKKVNLKIWGDERATSTIGFFDIINEDGVFDALYTTGAFGPIITAEISILFDTGSYDARFIAATKLIVEKVEPVGEDYLRLTIRDSAKLMEKAVGTTYLQTVNNQATRGTPKPVAIGLVNQQVPVKVNTTLNLMDLHDDRRLYWDGLTVSSRGVVATKGTDWRLAINSTCIGIEYLVSMTGGDPFTVNGLGAVDVASTLVDGTNGGDFTTWAGSPSLPSGWTLVGTMAAGVREFIQNVSALRFHVTTTGAVIALRKASITIPASGFVLVEFDITASAVTGPIDIVHVKSNGTTVIQTKTINVNGVGHYADVISVGAFFGSFIQLSCGGTLVDCTIDNFRAYSVTLTNTPTAAAKHLAVTRGGLPSANFDTAAWNLLDIPLYTDQVGILTQGDAMIADQLDLIARSYTGWWWFNRLGNLTIKQLFDPVIALASPVATLKSTQIVQGEDIKVEIDMCPGLSDTWAYDKNWYPLGDNDIAGSVTAANRALFSADYRVVASASVFVAPDSLYSHILGAPPIETCLMGMTQQTAEPNRVVGYYGNIRSFKTVKMVIDDSTYLSLDLGDLVNCDLTRFSVNANKHMVSGMDGTFLSNVVTITLWS